MGVKDLTKSEAKALEGTRHSVARFEYPAEGLSPYYTWLRNALKHLGDASAGWLRVHKSDAADDQIYVAPGRCVIDGVLLTYAGADVDLAAYQNDTAYVWLYNSGGTATIGTAADGTGWPSDAHIKLAEVTLATSVSSITDRRNEWMLRHESHPTYSISIETQGSTASASRLHIQLQDSDGRTVESQDILRCACVMTGAGVRRPMRPSPPPAPPRSWRTSARRPTKTWYCRATPTGCSRSISPTPPRRRRCCGSVPRRSARGMRTTHRRRMWRTLD